MNGTRIILRFPVSKLVNVSYRGRRVISKAESLGCTLDCGFKIPRRQASHHGTRLWIVGINKFPVSENAEGTIRGKIDKARICTKLRPLLSFIVFSISYTNIFLSPPPSLSLSLFLSTPLFFISHRITSLPVPPTGFSYCLFMSSISPSRPAPHFLHFSLRPLSNFHLSNSCVTTASYLTFAFFSLLAEKMPMARQKTVLHEVTGCQTFLSGLEGSPVFRSRYVHGDSTHGRGA